MEFHFILACTLDEYTCLDGACVHLDDVCDGISDCNDKSDELNCQSIRFDATYTKLQPPLSLEDKHNKKRLSVHIDMTILSVFELNEIQSWMKLQLILQVKWIDPRLKFANLKEGKQKNILSNDQKQKLWIPSLMFANNKDQLEAVFDSDSIGSIFLTENAKFDQSLNKTRIYEGKHG